MIVVGLSITRSPMTMKSVVRVVLLVGVLVGLVACHGQPQSSRLQIAATAIPHAEILNDVVKPQLAKSGIILDVRIFNDYVQPNDQVMQGQIDANYFQTLPYLESYNRDHHSDLVPVVAVHVEPFGAYSRRYHQLAGLPDHATVAIPNDPSNMARALILMHKHGLIQLADPANALATPHDIVRNERHLVIQELDAAMLPRVLDQVDLALINTNYALDAGLHPLQDALIIEDKDSPYANYLVVRPDNKDDPRIQQLSRALTSPEVKAYLQNHYKGAVMPAF